MAVCLFDGVQLLDYAGPMDLFGFLNAARPLHPNVAPHAPKFTLDFTYVGPVTEVQPTSGPAVMCTKTFAELLAGGEQFDVLLVPGGYGTRPNVISQDFLQFVRQQVPAAKYVLSVCTGSWVLAQAGTLDGRRATTNKSRFNDVVVRAQQRSSTSALIIPRRRQRASPSSGCPKRVG